MFYLITNDAVVFIVQYEQEVIHAVDGLGTGVVFVPVMGNFLVKVYRENDGDEEEEGTKIGAKSGVRGNPYGNIIKALLELVTYLLKN